MPVGVLGSDETLDFPLLAAGPMADFEALGGGFFITCRQARAALDLPMQEIATILYGCKKADELSRNKNPVNGPMNLSYQ